MFGNTGCVSCSYGYNFDEFGECYQECTAGCLVCIRGQCLACNDYHGYFSVDEGVCVKSGRVLGVGFLGILGGILAFFVHFGDLDGA